MTNDTGKKDDSGKRRWTLIPWKALGYVVDVLEYGARKYGDHNWRRVEDGVERYKNAAVRHLVAYLGGEFWDCCSEHDCAFARPADCPNCSGLPHLAHLGCDVLFLLTLELGL